MKTENYTTSILFFIGFFGIFILMNFQESISGEKKESRTVEEFGPMVNYTEFQPDTLHLE